MKELTILLLCIIGLFIYINYIRKSLHLSLVTSTVDGEKYLVRNLKDNVQAANYLSDISQSLERLIESVKNKKSKRESIDRLDNFNSKKITENIPGSMYVAYSVNKGEELSICIRDKETEDFLDRNTVIFVAIHELSHVMTKSVGHKSEFWQNFKFLLEQAKEAGLHQPVDYKQKPEEYCGMKIHDNPYYDA